MFLRSCNKRLIQPSALSLQHIFAQRECVIEQDQICSNKNVISRKIKISMLVKKLYCVSLSVNYIPKEGDLHTLSICLQTLDRLRYKYFD